MESSELAKWNRSRFREQPRVAWVIYDVRTANSALNAPLKVAWPIIIIFFSFSGIGIGLYWITSRPLDIAQYEGKKKMERFTGYSLDSLGLAHHDGRNVHSHQYGTPTHRKGSKQVPPI